MNTDPIAQRINARTQADMARRALDSRRMLVLPGPTLMHGLPTLLLWAEFTGRDL